MSLKDNLRQIYRSVQFSAASEPPLIANRSGTHLYVKKQGWCSFSDRLLGRKSENVPRALIHTHNLLLKHLHQVEAHCKQYQDYLNKSGKGYFVKESDYFTARKSITTWNRWSAPSFKELMQNGHFTKLEPLLSKCFPNTEKSQLQALFAPQTAIQVCQMQNVIDLEGISGGTLPLMIFKKIMRHKPLNTTDSNELDKWIWKINKAKPHPMDVHKAFIALAEQYQKKEERSSGKKPNPFMVEFSLQEKGLSIFQSEDPDHIQWRQQLQKGASIPLDNSSIILGDELHPTHLGSDKTRVFTIEGQPDRVALIAHNTTILPLRDLKMRLSYNFGLDPALVFDISSDGKVAVMERLIPINSIAWTSHNGQLSPADAPIVNAIADFIDKLVKKKQTPQDFSTAFLMLNANHQLKTLRPATKGPFDFTALEDFVLECSGNNLTVFQTLMTKSGLARHPVANFYADLLKTTLKKDPIKTDDLAAIYRIQDIKVVDRAALFVDKVNALKMQMQIASRDVPSKKIDETIIANYLNTKGANTLWV